MVRDFLLETDFRCLITDREREGGREGKTDKESKGRRREKKKRK